MMVVQVKCKIPELCDANGAFLVATDQGYGDRTDFVMSPQAFSRLGRNQNASAELKKYSTVDIEYRRVPCTFMGNVLFHIKESSSNPGYLAVVILNINGKYDVTAVEMWQCLTLLIQREVQSCWGFKWALIGWYQKSLFLLIGSLEQLTTPKFSFTRLKNSFWIPTTDYKIINGDSCTFPLRILWIRIK